MRGAHIVRRPPISTLETLYWNRGIPPIERREKLWTLRMFLHTGRCRGKYRAITFKRRLIKRREIILDWPAENEAREFC
jgi:hypothetical protein